MNTPPRRSSPSASLAATASAGRAQERSSLNAHADAPQGASGARVYVVIGPVGAGKSTFALQLARERGAVRLTLDEWMTELFRPDRPETGVVAWYVERAARCVDQIWRVAEGVLDAGVDVVLEVGLLQRRERADFYRRVAGHAWTLYVLDAAREVRRERVEQRNRMRGPTFCMVVPPDIFELASDLWQAPEHEECEGRDVRFLWTDAESG
jgi:predicted kinase